MCEYRRVRRERGTNQHRIFVRTKSTCRKLQGLTHVGIAASYPNHKFEGDGKSFPIHMSPYLYCWEDVSFLWPKTPPKRRSKIATNADQRRK